MEPPKMKTPPQPRITFTTAATSVAKSTVQLIEASRQTIDQIVSSISHEKATFENVLSTLAHCRNSIASEARVLSFYKEVSADADLRQESRNSKLLLDHFETEIAMREDLFMLVDSVARRKQDHLDLESQRLLHAELRSFSKNGLDLPSGPSRDRFRNIKMRLSEVTNDFRKNMIEESGSVEFYLDEMAGVPAEVLQTLERVDGSDQDVGKLCATFQSTHFYPVMRYAESNETRKRYFIAYENRCEQNVLLFKEAVLLRDEGARMLGHVNHAACRTGEMMTGNPENVLVFLHDLQSQLKPLCEAELQELRNLKKEYLEDRGLDFDGKFYVWDISFYHRLMLETQYSVDQKGIAEYFPVQTFVPLILHTFERVFGLTFKNLSDDTRGLKDLDLTWHEDVQLFDVWDSDNRGGSFLGYMYVDLFRREGKYGNVANFNLQPESTSGYLKPDGTRHYPSTALICNFNKPSPDVPSLLKHSDICLLFHELGHGIHDLVAKTTYSRFHGTATVDDFCEAPSQMLERWCWTAPQLKYLSRHYSTLTPEYFEYWKQKAVPEVPVATPPSRIPDEMIEALLRSEKLNAALTNMRSLWRSVFDMKVHAPPDRATLENMDFTHEFNALQRDIVGLDAPEDQSWGHGQAQFTHLFGGYDASFYGYLYSRVYASDMFATAFQLDPTDPVVGERYRRCVLEKGGSQDEMALLIEFLGRTPNPRAFYRELGITN